MLIILNSFSLIDVALLLLKQTSMNARVHLVKMEEVAIICKTATPALVHPDIQEQTAKQVRLSFLLKPYTRSTFSGKFYSKIVPEEN